MRRFAYIIMLLLACLPPVVAQDLTFQGQLRDAETGEPLPYASIYVAAGRGTLTNAEGNFSLSAGNQDVLTFSYVGYEKLKLKASDVPRVVKLKPFARDLEEVVVVPVDEWDVVKRVIKNLKKDFSKHKAEKQGYFMRTWMKDKRDSNLIECFMSALSAVNLHEEEFHSGICGVNAEGGSSRMKLAFTNIQFLSEVGPATFGSGFFENSVQPLNNLSMTKEYFDYKLETLFGTGGEKLYRIDFEWKEKERPDWQTRYLRDRHRILGTAYVDAKTLRLLRFKGKVGNAFVRYNNSQTLPNEINFQINYDYSKGYPAVNNLSVEGGNKQLQYKMLLFNVQDDNLLAEGGVLGNNIVNVIQNAGYDSQLWEKYDIIKRTAEEELIAFGETSQPVPETTGEEEPEEVETKEQEQQEPEKEIEYPEAFAPLMKRLTAFGNRIPQEKVFIHMDNTSYQVGDTIWFSAYLRRTDTGKPSDVSGVLYVELYGQEGYMIERKLIQMKEGQGSGFFALSNLIQYAGFYELRAYTRWQLNWGLYEHKHGLEMSEYFTSKRQEKEFYRDYEKLYSRVFPVYDKPQEPGEYTHDMTLRSMRRIYKNDPEKRELKLSLYPEGGNLVAGLPCRVAFEAAFDDGEWAEGVLVYDGDSIRTQNRGRGVFELVPQKGLEKDVLFVNKDGKTAKAKLPKPKQTGVSLKVEKTDSCWVAHIRNTDDIPSDSLGVSLMCEGRTVSPPLLQLSQKEENLVLIPSPGEDGKGLPSGVYQLTVFDTQGRVFADRLFFNRGKEDFNPTVSIEGLKEEYQPYEPVNLTLKAPQNKSAVSITVRDDSRRDLLYDNGNILTEMLLSSEIRGFVPQPGWYFEKDDEEHRLALDLLMMTQGWRRFDWQSMAVPGLWGIREPAELAPILIGRTYENVNPYDDETIAKQDKDELEEDFSDFYSNDSRVSRDSYYDSGRSPRDRDDYRVEYDLPMQGDWGRQDERIARDKTGYRRSIEKKAEKDKKRTELKVHGEQILVDYDEPVECECVTNRGEFLIQLLPFYGQSVLFLSVADTTKWKKGEQYLWVQAEPDNEYTDFDYLPANAKARRKIFVEPADYLARIVWPYPHFVKPYSFYQSRVAPQDQQEKSPDKWVKMGDETLMREVTVRAKRNTLRRFDDTWPILAIDALEADNMCTDYGLDFMRIMVGDFGVGTNPKLNEVNMEKTFETRYGYGKTRRMLLDYEIPKDSIYARKYLISGTFSLRSSFGGPSGPGGDGPGLTLSPGESREYMGTGIWDKYVFYSDYSPRMEGSELYYGGNEPKTTLVLYPYANGSRRMTYRDRRYILNGFAYPAEFYSPDYSKQTPSEETKDYRRTLYWNPNMKLDDKGEAEIKFYNNSRQTTLSIEAEGQAQDGTLLWGEW